MFHGSMVAIVTPMLEGTGDVDYPALTTLIEWHIEQGTHAIVAAGTTGESATLTDQERLSVIKHTVDIVAERIPVIAGTGSESTQHTITLTQGAMDAGADAALIMTPAYIKPTQAGLIQHYRAIAQAVHLPIIVYNVPGRTACDLMPHTLNELSSVPNIIGIKEATGSFERAQEIYALCADTIDVYSGDDVTAAELLLGPAKGVISVTANVAPALMAKMCEAALAHDAEQVTAINADLAALHKAMFLESNPIPVKWALHEMGLISPAIRLPLTPLSEAHHDTIRTVLKALQ